ncbi:hypothetical protein LWF01_02725 [Saxibacter everestensis]|uniref:Uncharacterized protein n=1 Tax=Saxibacter everestensis TaxID=2909229 RepID=A0ABY8QUT3_9MICO|nr:hypothetical protein LWF01_02725 [Brevibacteriaceae bacterium ZFBP1038]
MIQQIPADLAPAVRDLDYGTCEEAAARISAAGVPIRHVESMIREHRIHAGIPVEGLERVTS